MISHAARVQKLVFRTTHNIFPPKSSYCWRCFGRKKTYIALANPNRDVTVYNRIATIVCSACAGDEEYTIRLRRLLDYEREGGDRPVYTTVSLDTAMSIRAGL